MKKSVLPVIFALVVTSQAQSQIVYDTVTTNPTYTHNVWYSLANDEQASASATEWDLALATHMGATDVLTTAVLFNHKIGSVYEIPGSDPADFANADTTGLAGWTPLFNSDVSWGAGAFNNTADLGSFDYGWGSYNMATHGVDANRIFVIRYTSGSWRKLIISSQNTADTYTVVSAALDNSNTETTVIDVAPYQSKNFVYYNVLNDQIIDREPAASDWDLVFHQYPSFDYNPPYTVTGVFQNLGVEIAKVYPVNDPLTYSDYAAHTFSEEINTIGYDWKAFGGMGFIIEDSSVYFVKAKDGSLWRLIMTGFGGSGSGKYMFAKALISAVGMEEPTALVTALYPNPATHTATLVVANAAGATVVVYDLSGAVVYRSEIAATSELTTVQLPVSELAGGMYRVVVANATNFSSHQLMVQH